MIFKELTNKEELRRSYTVMSNLADHLNEKEYLSLLDDMIRDGYRLFVLADQDDQYLAVVGLFIRTDLYNGRHLWISELVTLKEKRSKGIGRMLMSEVTKVAHHEGCEKIILYSGITRYEAHHFWEDHMNYERRGIVFKKEL